MKNKYMMTVRAVGIAAAGILVTGSAFAQAPGQAPAAPGAPAQPAAPKMSTEEAFKIGAYVLGFQQGSGLYGAGFNADEFSSEELLKGLQAGMKGEDSAISEEKMRQAMQILQGLARGERSQVAQERAKVAQEKAVKKLREQHADKIAKQEKFLADNAKREGVKTTESGLQYEVLKKGGERKYVAPAGGAPDFGTKFMVHYKGTLIDGTEFDASAKHNPDGKPAEFTLGVVPGFAEALKMMPVGAKWKIYLPAELAYNESPRGPGGPFSALIFELELVDIKSAPARPPVAPGAGQPVRPKASATTPPVPVPAPPKQGGDKKEKAE